MDKIRVLTDGVANQIAAGEVVIRPASVVKELIENSVDAKSSSVIVSYRDGGKELIQVVDNGSGMSAPDARMAFERHATSKIVSTEDLYRLSSYGFRGEALPSIASIAEVELRSRTEDSELGTKVLINGGKFEEQTLINTPKGTQFLIKNLFYNIPARRRFLKDAATEGRHIVTEFQRVALCYPEIAFALYNNEVIVCNLPVSNLRQRIVGVCSKGISANLLDVSVKTSIVDIEGFVGRPVAAKKINKDQYLFVNGRYFRSSYLHKAIVKAYEKLIPADTQPSYFLYLKINPERIDVNVHPTKTEIKFDDEQAMWQIINAAVRETLGRTGVVPLMDFEIDTSIDIPVYKKGVNYRIPETGADPLFNPFSSQGGQSQSNSYGGGTLSRQDIVGDWDRAYKANDDLYDEVESKASALDSQFISRDFANIQEASIGSDDSLYEFISGEDMSPVLTLDFGDDISFRGLLKIDQRHYATVIKDGLLLVDVKRARERVIFERYMQLLGNNTAVSQQLLFPERVELGAQEIALVVGFNEEIAAMGFDFTVQDNLVDVSGIPPEITSGAIGQTLGRVIDAIQESGALPTSQRIECLAAIMATQGSLTGWDLGEEMARSLLEELFACRDFSFTPSGLPIVSLVSQSELNKRFR